MKNIQNYLDINNMIKYIKTFRYKYYEDEMGKNITIKDIAEKAGVSASTVSLVLNNKGYVAEETRNKIQKVIEDMDYRPLHSARKLATRLTDNIGYIVWEDHFSEVEAFYSQIFLGMEYATRDSDQYILLTTVKEEFDPKTDLPRFLKYNDVDGVALAGRVPHSLIDYLSKKNIPFVLIDYGLSGRTCNSIVIDNYTGGYKATQHLVDKGRKKISYVGGSFIHPSIKERYRGYQDVIRENGLDTEDYFDKYTYLKKEETLPGIGKEGVRKLFNGKDHPDAIFCCNDTTALGVTSELKNIGKEIPKEVAVVGFDDIPPASLSQPSLSTVRVPKLTIGKESYKLLQELIQNPQATSQTRTISVEFIERDSS